MIDIADPNWQEAVTAVEKVLKEIGAGDVKIIQVFNKIDLLEGLDAKIDCQEDSCKVWVSAATGAGLDLLRETIASQLHGTIIDEEMELTSNDAKLRAHLYDVGAVLSESVTDEGGWRVHIRMSKAEKERLLRAV